MSGLFLGIDTSNYTTSVALIDESGKLLANIKYPLPVKAGEHGLRQSDAVFSHIKNLPLAMNDAREIIADNKILAIGVSSRPRNLDGSYMPCFLSGVVAATSAATVSGAPLYTFSHQCGHVMAALYSSGRFDLMDKEFAAFHVSGGTTELLKVFPENEGFVAEHIGGTRDLNAGQVIDRIGVMMDMPFPAGRHIEEYALKNQHKIPKKKISSEGLWINLSGLENMAKKLYDDTLSKELTSAFVLDYVGNSLLALCEAYEERFGRSEFVFSGGVMSNSIIKEKLAKSFTSSFAEPALSADNAVGIAYLALRAYNKNV